jgi:hypothetical protein
MSCGWAARFATRCEGRECLLRRSGLKRGIRGICLSDGVDPRWPRRGSRRRDETGRCRPGRLCDSGAIDGRLGGRHGLSRPSRSPDLVGPGEAGQHWRRRRGTHGRRRDHLGPSRCLCRETGKTLSWRGYSGHVVRCHGRGWWRWAPRRGDRRRHDTAGGRGDAWRCRR